MKKTLVNVVLFVSCSFIFWGTVPAALGSEGLEPVAQSQAYQEFLKKPGNDLAKMICLLNYFRFSPVVVRFEGIDYTAQAAYPFGLVYLMTNYRGEKPDTWARKHCYRSLFGNNIIFFKFQDGSSRPARDVILEKYYELETAQQKRASQVQ
ncbi:MAG: hypothetical protein A2351_01970 [Omnitrophica bacterium RIFOXYB12_FULL_50_7]|nr:MAG: hypothetical protein A2351_01970 [Omnitrophica bacterium RIFOXYB12_FULL_50_7]